MRATVLVTLVAGSLLVSQGWVAEAQPQGRVRFGVDESRSGCVTVTCDEGAAPLAGPGERTAGSWEVEMGLADAPEESWAPTGTASVQRRGSDMLVEVVSAGLRLQQAWRPWPVPAGLVGDTWLVNDRAESVVVGRARFSAGPLRLGGELADDEYVYPPGVFQEMRGMVSEAEPGRMGGRYIYGCLQATDKLMLPLAAVLDRGVGMAVGLACRNDQAAVRVGVVGGEAGRLEALVSLGCSLAPGERLYLGRVSLGLWARGGGQPPEVDAALALRAFRNAAVGGGIVQPPEPQREFVKGLQIAWVGPYCPPYATLDDIAARLPAMAEGGINAIIIGGRTWYCPSSLDPASPDFLPILKDGRYTAEGNGSGGEEGLRRLVAEAHRLGVKAFCWGPTLAGVSLQSPEVESRPEWWIRKADGTLNPWYATMAPPDSSVAGWRELICDTVARFITEYDLDGCWLDSTWKDHGLNHQNAEGWPGGPNGAKVSLLREIRKRAKALKPDFVLMAESGGAETASAVDLWYPRALGVFPLVGPEEMQEAVMAEEACRPEGVLPFGQYQVDPGPLGEPHPVRTPLLARESYQATLFLSNTLPRVPVYYVGDPLAGLLDEPALGEVTRRLMAVRRANPELMDGDVLFGGLRSTAAQLVRFWRMAGERVSLVVVNCGAEPVTARLLLSGPPAAGYLAAGGVVDLLGQAQTGPVKAAGQGEGAVLEVRLPGYRGAILKATQSL